MSKRQRIASQNMKSPERHGLSIHTMDQIRDNDEVAALADYLREENRIKINVDYCLSYSSGKYHLLCNGSYETTIIEASLKFNICFYTIRNYK